MPGVPLDTLPPFGQGLGSVCASPLLPEPVTTLRGARGSLLRFYHGDAVALLGHLPAARAAVIVTSPPYNLGIRYRSYDDKLTNESYLAWTDRWLRGARRILRDDGSLFLNVGVKPTSPWAAIDIALQARDHFDLQNTIHWVKSIVIERDAVGERAGLTRDLAVGHYKPINSTRFLNDCHEYVFHLTPSGHTPLDRQAIGVAYQDPSNARRWRGAGQGRRCRGNAWFIPYETIQDRDRQRPHPATFPLRLPEQCLRLHGLKRASLVVDPFLGLGSTAVACARLGLDFVGIEIDDTYLAEAVERTSQALAHPTSSKPS